MYRGHRAFQSCVRACIRACVWVYLCAGVSMCACVCILLYIICPQVGSRVQRPRGVPVASTTDWCHEQIARTVPGSVPPTTNVPTTNAWPPRWVEVINRPRPTGGDVVSTNAPR